MLTLILCSSSCNKTNMLGNLVTVILEINKLAYMIFVMGYAGRKDRYARICSYPIKSIFL